MMEHKKNMDDAAWLRSLMREQIEDLRPLLHKEVQHAIRELRGSMERIAQPFQADAERLNSELIKARQQWQDAHDHALRQKKRLTAIIAGLLALCLTSLGLTYEALYGYYQSRYTQLVDSTSYLEAIHRSDVVPCEEGRVCARIDAKSSPLGDKGQYRLIELRQ